MIIKVTNADTHYGGIRALRDVSVTVMQGEFVALIGSNGAGKTTFLHTISGLKRLTSGSIKFQDKEISTLPAEKIVKLGICHCPEGRHVWKQMTVRENLMLGAYARRKRGRTLASDIDHIYALFPILEERQKQVAGTLSGGEQQMLAVGRALMGAPKLLLLDEPSLGLAPIVIQELARAFQEINDNGVSILLVEQNANMALRLSSRTYVLETGSIVMEGASEKLINDPAVKDAYLGGSSFKP
jgi:branched-chain amino acid transport system ATP-binding protein